MTKHTRYWPMGCTNVVVRLGMLTVIVLPSICAGNAVVGSRQIAAQDKEAKNTIVSSRDKIKEARQACFAALKKKKNDTAMGIEGADDLKRNGEAYVLRIRLFFFVLFGCFLCSFFVCVVVVSFVV